MSHYRLLFANAIYSLDIRDVDSTSNVILATELYALDCGFSLSNTIRGYLMAKENIYNNNRGRH